MIDFILVVHALISFLLLFGFELIEFSISTYLISNFNLMIE